MKWTKQSVRKSIPTIAVAGVLIAIPFAGVSVPAYATEAPRPAAPPTDAPEPPPPPPLPAMPAQSSDYDWWTSGAGTGGGGGGG